MTKPITTNRLHGLDLARFLAYVGMVIVNFSVVMGADDAGGLFGSMITSFQGRAAATFVVLAGVGLGLSLAPKSSNDSTTFLTKGVWLTTKRAGFLLVAGLLNMLVFSADILHYYSFYFFFGALLASNSKTKLIGFIVLLNVVSVFLLLTLDFDKGWDYSTLEYAGFWTPEGFIRNLFFNGWHPVIPWLGFLLYGIIISRINLHSRVSQKRLIIWGLLVFVLTEMLSKLMLRLDSDELTQILFATDSIPAMPLYSLAGMSVASVIVGICLMFGDRFANSRMLRLLGAPGKQTLTLYIAHILIGMSILDELGMIGVAQPPALVLAVALSFVAVMLIYANIWQAYFKRGPLEALMRKVTG